MKKFGLTIIAILSLLVLSGCCLQHQWEEATCSTPRTCLECGKVDGEPTEEHIWIEANCDTAKQCSTCKKYEGNPLGHEWKDATCTEAKTCMRCGDVGSEALGHEWKDATCTEAKTCTRCGDVGSEMLGHQYKGNDFLCGRCGEEAVFDSGDMEEILSQCVTDYSSFYDNYVGKTFVMKVMKSDVDGGILYGTNIYVNGKCFFTTYKPAVGETKLLKAGAFPVIRARLDSVTKGFFNGQYIVFFKNATLERETWND